VLAFTIAERNESIFLIFDETNKIEQKINFLSFVIVASYFQLYVGGLTEQCCASIWTYGHEIYSSLKIDMYTLFRILLASMYIFLMPNRWMLILSSFGGLRK
jgi:hypothetical protein